MSEIPRIPFRASPYESPDWVDSEAVKTGAVFGLGLIVGAVGAAVFLSRRQDTQTRHVSTGEAGPTVVRRAQVATRDEASLGAIVKDEVRGGIRAATTALTEVLRERVAWLLGADAPASDPTKDDPVS